jgi:hypothetical protein
MALKGALAQQKGIAGLNMVRPSLLPLSQLHTDNNTFFSGTCLEIQSIGPSPAPSEDPWDSPPPSNLSPPPSSSKDKHDDKPNPITKGNETLAGPNPPSFNPHFVFFPLNPTYTSFRTVHSS